MVIIRCHNFLQWTEIFAFSLVGLRVRVTHLSLMGVSAFVFYFRIRLKISDLSTRRTKVTFPGSGCCAVCILHLPAPTGKAGQQANAAIPSRPTLPSMKPDLLCVLPRLVCYPQLTLSRLDSFCFITHRSDLTLLDRSYR